MADVKWIKITTDIFDDEKILLIESLPEPYAIITVWFKLLCLAGKQNNSGVFMMGKIAYTDEMLATIFRMKKPTVTMAIDVFQQFGMIEVIDGVITIPNWEKHQSLDKFELAREKTRERVARHREKQKLLAECNADCNVTVTQCNADRIEEDKDKEIDRDKEKKRNTESRKKQTDTFTLFEKIYAEYNFSDSLILKIREWLTYKAERKEAYAEQGLKSLLTQIKKNSNKYGENAVCDLIEECMASNWKGIIFERLKVKENQPQSSNKSYDTDEFFEAALRRSARDLYVDKPQPKTAGEDEAIRQKAEDLKARLG